MERGIELTSLVGVEMVEFAQVKLTWVKLMISKPAPDEVHTFEVDEIFGKTSWLTGIDQTAFGTSGVAPAGERILEVLTKSMPNFEKGVFLCPVNAEIPEATMPIHFFRFG